MAKKTTKAEINVVPSPEEFAWAIEREGLERQIARLRTDLKGEKDKVRQIRNELEESEGRMEFVRELDCAIDWRHLERLEAQSGGDATACGVFTDWHLEERVDRATTNGANQYDLKIAEARSKRAFEKFVEMTEWARHFHGANIRRAVLFWLGDFMTGFIHEEYEESNYLSPTQTCLVMRDWLSSGLRFVLNETGVDHVDIVTAFGNHGRTTKKMRVKTAWRNSYEWLIYNVIASDKEFAKDDRVRWHIGKGYHNWIRLHGHDIRAHHGDAIKYQDGIGGISVPVNKAVSQWNKQKRAALDVFGHWHQYHDWGPWVSSGSLIGYDEFSLRIKAEYQPPSQTFFVVSRKYPKTFAAQMFVE